MRSSNNFCVGSNSLPHLQIASPYGSSVPPEHPTQSNGEPVPWGTGHLVSRHRNHEQDEEQGITSEDSGDGPINGHDATLITRSSGDPNSQRSQTQASRETESLHQNSSTVDIRATGTSDRPQTVATPIPLPSPIALPAPARKGQLTASGSSSHVVSPPTQPSDPGILLKSMQLTSGTVKINVGLNIVPSILVALFILF